MQPPKQGAKLLFLNPIFSQKMELVVVEVRCCASKTPLGKTKVVVVALQ